MFEPSTQRARAIKEQAKLRDELWEIIERAVARWEPDDEMDDLMTSGVLMAVVSTFSGDMLAVVMNAMGITNRDALKRGAELIRNGALARAIMAIAQLEAEKEAARH